MDRYSLEEIEILEPEQEPEQPAFGEGVYEAAKTVGSGIASTIGGGYAGLGSVAKGLLSGEGLEQAVDRGVQTVGDVQQEYTYVPRTQAGQEVAGYISDEIGGIENVARYPMSGYVGVGELGWGSGVDQAVESTRQAQSDLSGTLGGRMLERTGSPELATAAHMAPAGLEAMIGYRAANRAPQAFEAGFDLASDAARGSTRPIIETTRALRSGFQGPEKRAIASDILAGSTKNELAPYRVADFSPGSETPITSPVLASFAQRHGPTVQPDPPARSSLNQGFRQGTVQAIKNSSPADRKKMRKMLDIKERAYNDDTFALTGRPSDVVGDTILTPLRTLRDINRAAAAQLDDASDMLRGQYVDYTQPVNNFLANLGKMDIKFTDDMTPIYRGSDIDKLPRVQSIVNNIIDRMKDVDTTDAYAVHQLKKYIDENVTYGKMGEGFGGNSERILKQLRHDINMMLQDSFPEYKRVNTTYAETIDAIDELQSFMPGKGEKIDISGEFGDMAMGTLARKIGSNYASRVPLLQSLAKIEDIYRKYSANPDIPKIEGSGLGAEDYKAQLMFANALDEVFGASGRNTFQGQQEAALNAAGNLAEGVVAGTPNSATAFVTGLNILKDKVKGRNPDAAFKALRELLDAEGYE